MGQWKSKVGRIAAPYDGYARVLCVCKAGNVYENTAGELRQNTISFNDDLFVGVYCAVQIFTNDALKEPNGFYACTEFLPLPR